MNNIEDTEADLCAIYVDMGTTNTRAWLMRGSEVVARANKPVGVRDTARDGSTRRIHDALREVITIVRTRAIDSLDSFVPKCVVTAGMITSSLGLAELPHVCAPAGIQELATSSRWFQFPQITDLPFLLIPGVRSGPATVSLDSLNRVDVMRGEETLCLELADEGTAEDRFSFLAGVFIAADLDAFVAQGILAGNVQVAISGNLAIAEAWRIVFNRKSIPAVVLSADESESALLAGLRCILVQSYQRQESNIEMPARSAMNRTRGDCKPEG